MLAKFQEFAIILTYFWINSFFHFMMNNVGRTVGEWVPDGLKYRRVCVCRSLVRISIRACFCLSSGCLKRTIMLRGCSPFLLSIIMTCEWDSAAAAVERVIVLNVDDSLGRNMKSSSSAFYPLPFTKWLASHCCLKVMVSSSFSSEDQWSVCEECGISAYVPSIPST